jgi:hypothetical protein
MTDPILIAPVDLDNVKSDLGITDDYDDNWLIRRCNGIWSRFQIYTGRPLLLSSQWMDDWSHIAPPPWWWTSRQGVSEFLKVYPVQSVDGLVVGGAAGDEATVFFDRLSGRILSYGVTVPMYCVGASLLTDAAVITYTAGFEVLPEDLYEALIGCLTEMWTARQLQGAGTTGRVSSISAGDLGEVQFSSDLAGFIGDASKRISADPMLGPWKAVLDPYRDYRSFLGNDMKPRTTAVES